jgi:hypothetical protein
MKSMLVLANKDYVAFFNKDDEHLAKLLRKHDSRMKHARMTEGIQFYPNIIATGKVYDRNIPWREQK